MNNPSDLSQLGSTQSDFVNQFVSGSTNTAVPAPTAQTPGQNNSMNPAVPVNQVQDVSMTPPPVATNPVQGTPVVTTPTFSTDPVQNTPEPTPATPANLVQNFPVQTPTVPTDPVESTPMATSTIPTEPVPSAFSPSVTAPAAPVSMDDFSLTPPVNQPSMGDVSAVSPSTVPDENMAPVTEPIGQTSSLNTDVYNQAVDPVSPTQNSGVMPPVSAATPPPVANYQPEPAATVVTPALDTLGNIPSAPVAQTTTPPPMVGQQQVTINEEYADNFNNAFRSHIPTQGLNLKTPEPQAVNFASPPMNLVVDNQYSDGMMRDNSGSVTTGTNLLPAYDDSQSFGLALANDDDDNGDEFEGDDDLSSFGFSDFDPNDQNDKPTEDILSNFESNSLAAVTDEEQIDVDYSDAAVSDLSQQQQQVGLLEPQQTGFVHQNHDMQIATEIDNLNSLSALQFNQTVEPVNASLSEGRPVQEIKTFDQQEPEAVDQTPENMTPAAKLNQLLEAEESAEKMIMQKQEQVLKDAPAPAVANKSHIFKQINSDIASDADFRGEMNTNKPSSRYFLILSLVIIISVIGFLLVLLGLVLL